MAKGGKGKGRTATSNVGSPAIALDQTDPHYGDVVTFTWTSDYPPDENNTGPWLRLEAYQDGDHVFFDQRAGFPGGYAYGTPFTLGGSVAWPSGQAECVASVGHFLLPEQNYVADATVTFHVNA